MKVRAVFPSEHKIDRLNSDEGAYIESVNHAFNKMRTRGDE